MAAEAARAAAAIGFPAVMKVVSPAILHKSEFGGVILDIDDETVRGELVWLLPPRISALA